ncbi:MAG: hypothetical protein Q4P28_01525 [Tissierellia bacterium]|nr:hypothetical protein [Tissierellia bacterium]
MLSLKDMVPDDLEILMEKFPMDLNISLELPSYLYVFRENEKILGYSRITIGDKVYLEDFQILSDKKEYALFFLKSTGFKVHQLGHGVFYDRKGCTEDFYPGKKIILDELFQGDCRASH